MGPSGSMAWRLGSSRVVWFRSSFLSAVMLIAAGWTFAACAAELRTAKDRDDPQVRKGRELFEHKWTVNDPLSRAGDGLGPMCNARSCAECHNQGGAGGGGDNTHNVQFLNLVPRRGDPSGDDLIKLVTQLHPGLATEPTVVLHRFGAAGYKPWRESRLAMVTHVGGLFALAPTELVWEELPPEVHAQLLNDQWASRIDLDSEVRLQRMHEVAESAQSRADASRRSVKATLSERNTPALFGAGLIDAIPDKVLERMTSRQGVDAKIRGRLPKLKDGRFGRFGWKSQKATLTDFALNACAVEIGLEVPNHKQAAIPTDPGYEAPGLDMDEDDCAALLAYLKSLAPPTASARASADAASGRKLFARVGCTDCHVERLGAVQGIYSDLLLHRMGDSLAGTGGYGGPSFFNVASRAAEGASADDTEWRTPPLWGCSYSAPYLHDGRAATLEDAVRLHTGQGEPSAEAFKELPIDDQNRLLAFLQTL